MELQQCFLGAPLVIRWEWIGGDLNVCCFGGTRPHLGGSAAALPYQGSRGTRASVSTICVPGHQDGVLASALANRLCRRLSCTVFVQCGIHYDNLSAQALQDLEALVLQMSDRLEVPK